jgi:CubicO group peptidase (beta-lactamase class C family)/beta-glucosidase-like glycosyl hydrolase
MQKKVWLIFLMAGPLFSTTLAQSRQTQWVDSVFQTLTLNHKIGQLMMIPVNSLTTADEAEQLIRNFGIGGVVFTDGSPVRQVQLTNRLQQNSVVPLLIGMNAEEGLGAVLDSTLTYPYSLMLGALTGDSLIFRLGTELGRQLKALGVHLNFGPTADLSTHFQRDDLLYHSFGENAPKVASQATAYMNGLSQAGVIPVVKHFPDYGLKVKGFENLNTLSPAREDSVQIYPLQQLFKNNCKALLSAYQHDPIFPDRRKRFTSEKKLLNEALPTLVNADYLKKNLGYQGLLFSYVPDVKLFLDKYKAGDSELYAFLAGNDILLFPENIRAAVKKLRKKIKRQPALAGQLNESVRKILRLKFDAGLDHPGPVREENLISKINTPEARILRQALFEGSLTVIRNEQGLIPITYLDGEPLASLSVGMPAQNSFSHYLSKYAPFKHYQLQQLADTASLIQNLKTYKKVVVGVFPYASGLEAEYTSLIKVLAAHTQVIICNFTSPSKLDLAPTAPVVIQAYTDEEIPVRGAVQILFGSLPATGVLPVSVTEHVRAGLGLKTSSKQRLRYAEPEEVGVSSMTLAKIGSIAREAIETRATPGCQVVVARKGKIIYEKSFGWFTYGNRVPVTDETIYDLASLTKITATLQAIMFLEEKGILDINKKASMYLPELMSTNKKDMIVKDILTHQAGLVPFEPWWPQTISDSTWSHFYSTEKNENYPLQVANHLYAANHIKDSVWQWTVKSKLLVKSDRTPYPFRYSDLSFIILYRLAEKLLNQPVEDFVKQNLYEPLGAGTLGYLPLERFDSSQIAPTEYDTVFRKSMLIGTVHDERAAMLGGLSGHAGLFGNANDLAKLGQMLLQQGYYGGHSYYKPETVNRFTNKQYDTSRRGLGWDKPVQSEWNSPTSVWASPRTFGHTGFTGTCLWVDPEFDLVYVFLSNRVHPDRSNKLITSNIRSRIQDVIYQSIFEYCNE